MLYSALFCIILVLLQKAWMENVDFAIVLAMCSVNVFDSPMLMEFHCFHRFHCISLISALTVEIIIDCFGLILIAS